VGDDPVRDILTAKPKMSIWDWFVPGRYRQREREMVDTWVKDSMGGRKFADGAIVQGKFADGRIDLDDGPT